MINFVVPDIVHQNYKPVLDLMMSNIMPVTTEYTVENVTKDNYVNVHFFLEQDVIDTVGMRGLNVFIPHGIADKGYRDRETTEQFDLTIVSGPLWERKLMNQGMPQEKIFVGGYPKMDQLFNRENTGNKVLWAPTHNCSIYTQDIVSSYPALLDHWSELTNHFNINIALHPANKTNGMPTTDDLLNASVVIADYGSTIYEAWALGIPVVFPDWIVREGIIRLAVGTFEGMIYRQNIDYHASSLLEFLELIEYAQHNGMHNTAINFINEIFPENLRGKSGNTIYNKLKDMEAKLC